MFPCHLQLFGVFWRLMGQTNFALNKLAFTAKTSCSQCTVTVNSQICQHLPRHMVVVHENTVLSTLIRVLVDHIGNKLSSRTHFRKPLHWETTKWAPKEIENVPVYSSIAAEIHKTNGHHLTQMNQHITVHQEFPSQLMQDWLAEVHILRAGNHHILQNSWFCVTHYLHHLGSPWLTKAKSWQHLASTHLFSWSVHLSFLPPLPCFPRCHATFPCLPQIERALTTFILVALVVTPPHLIKLRDCVT